MRSHVWLMLCGMLSCELQYMNGEVWCGVGSKYVLSIVGAAAMFGKGRKWVSISIGFYSNCNPVGSQPSTGH